MRAVYPNHTMGTAVVAVDDVIAQVASVTRQRCGPGGSLGYTMGLITRSPLRGTEVYASPSGDR
jgi:hypothetical protein